MSVSLALEFGKNLWLLWPEEDRGSDAALISGPRSLETQLPIPAFWVTESWKPATMLRETKYPHGAALCGCLDQQPLLSSQPTANINCQACECRSLQMIPASSYRVTPSLPSWGFRLCRAEVSCPHNAFSRSLIHRVQKHNNGCCFMSLSVGGLLTQQWITRTVANLYWTLDVCLTLF